jgi:hypothetical protein
MYFIIPLYLYIFIYTIYILYSFRAGAAIYSFKRGVYEQPAAAGQPTSQPTDNSQQGSKRRRVEATEAEPGIILIYFAVYVVLLYCCM